MKRFIMLLAFLIVVPCAARAADFRAEVDRDKVTSGDSLTLQLTLSGARAASDPDLSGLAQSFDIVSEGQSSSTEIFNGKASSSTGWVLTLVPKAEGQAVIPAITVETSEGSLRSDPVTIDVSRGGPPAPNTAPYNAPNAAQADADRRAVTVSAEADTLTPYKNQPVHYTVRVYARADIAGVGLQDIALDNAVVEKQGQPEMRDQTVNGRPVRVILFHYLITPLQPGKLTIPPAVLQGQVEDTSPARVPSPFDENSFADPFRMLQAMRSMSPFGMMKPFSIASNAVTLDVAAPPVAMDPWLPLGDLKIKEEWDEKQQARVGEPLTRKISLLADGGVASQLPDLETRQNHADFKVYADKPRTGNDTDRATGDSYAWREESYSLIPTKYGRLTLPAIRVPYWNLKTDSLAAAELPARVIDVQPPLPGQASATPSMQTAPQTATQALAQPQTASSAPMAAPAAATGVAMQGPALWLYAVIAVLLAVLLFAALWAISLQRKIHRLGTAGVAPSAPVKPAPPRRAANQGLETVRTPDDLGAFLRAFAHERWNLPAAASLESVAAAWPASGRADIQDVARDLSAALYAGQEIDLENLKSRVTAAIAAIRPDAAPARKGPEKLPGLNPG